MKKHKKFLIYLLTILSIFCFGVAFSSCTTESYEDYFVYTLNEDGKSYSVGFFTEESYNDLIKKANESDKTFKTIEEQLEYTRTLFPILQSTEPIILPSSYNNLPVTRISDYGFALSSFESITIPNSITSIGDYAFYWCSKLMNISIPDSITTIGIDAFCDCYNLQYNEYENGLYLGNDDNNYTILIQVSSTENSSFIIHNTTKVIYRKAFFDNKNLTNITIPTSVNSIGDEAFYNCTGLTSVYIESIEAWCNIDFDSADSNPLCYGANLYLNNQLFADLMIPDTVTQIKNYAFYGCRNLTSVSISNSVTCIGRNAFRDCSSLISVAIPDSVTSISDYAFWGCTSLEGVYIENIEIWCNIDFDSIDSNPLRYAKNLYLNNQLVTDLVIPNTVTKIKDYAFYYCNNLIKVEIPDSVISIGYESFYCCENLTSATIPDSVTFIGSTAFGGCNNLQYYEYDNGLYLGNEDNKYILFIKSTSTDISSCEIHSNTKFIAISAFEDNINLINITIPDSVTTIGSRAFYDCSSLTSITIPKSITNIGRYAFLGCNNLEDVYIESVEAWCNIDFVNFPNNTASPLCYAHNLYLNNQLITDLIIPDTITKINDYTFYNCKSLTSITIPDSVTSIGNFAFYECDSLTSVTIGDSVTAIGDYAFSRCPIENASMPTIAIPYITKSNLKSVIITSGNSINKNAFQNCKNLISVEISNSVTHIGIGAFSDCTNLKSITLPFIGETENKTDNTHFGFIFGANDSNSNKKYVPSSLKTVVVIGGSINAKAFYNCDSLINVIIENPVNFIGSSAFSRCDNLTSIIIPDSVTYIGSYAFSRCSSLTSVKFENPNGWWYSYTTMATEASGTEIPHWALSTSKTAAVYLTETYNSYYWKRTD